LAGLKIFLSDFSLAAGSVRPECWAFAGDPAPACSANRFEFVVADAGVGVLQSLRTHPHFAYVKDSGTALELALSEGVSRFYDDKDRGRGFRPIFVGLANASSHLRFRSADHSREIVRGHGGRLLATTHQRASLKGFLCSAICEAP